MGQEQYLTTRIWAKTLKTLRFIKAHTGESIVAILDRLAQAELERLEKLAKEREKSHHPPETE